MDEEFNKVTTWDSFKKAAEEHIEYLKRMENKDPGFKCPCKVCGWLINACEWE